MLFSLEKCYYFRMQRLSCRMLFQIVVTSYRQKWSIFSKCAASSDCSDFSVEVYNHLVATFYRSLGSDFIQVSFGSDFLQASFGPFKK